MTVKNFNFVRIAWTVKKIEKCPKMAVFGHFQANLGDVSLIPIIRFRRRCARRSTFGCKMTVQNFMEIIDSF